MVGSGILPGARVGVDENGLGPRLGPLVVTAVWADVDEQGEKRIKRPLPKALRADLDDSKALVSSGNVALGEAWARAVILATTGKAPKTPRELLSQLSLQSDQALRTDCPPGSEAQCFFLDGDRFEASDEQVSRGLKQLERLTALGISVRLARSEIVCTGRLNALKAEGIHRFAADLHAMERLVLHMRTHTRRPLRAVCGKVGGMTKYEPFFGPLSGRLRTVLEESKAQSGYSFPGLGEVHFVRDADASDPLVMLASLIGKYVRELLMGRITGFYAKELAQADLSASGYHDPITARFVALTAPVRRQLKIVDSCFERVGQRP